MSSIHSMNKLTSSSSTSSSLTLNNKSRSILPRNKSRNLLFPIAVANRTYPDIIREKQQQQEIKSSTMIPDIIGNTNDDILYIHGYKRVKSLAQTLQGEVFIASSIHRDTLMMNGYIRESLTPHHQYHQFEITDVCMMYIHSNNDFVIKKACKSLHEQKATFCEITGEKITVQEDIVKEAEIMEMLERDECPKQIIKYFEFFEDDDAYYLVMERGGNGLFEFVVECHQHIVNGKLSIIEWRKAVRKIFYYMVAVVAWMHRIRHVCHLDISLENVVMSRDTYFDETDGKIKNLDIRMIDMGLAQTFDIKANPKFHCNKYVGKTGYQAPKVFNCKPFMANKADIWSLGISLFVCFKNISFYIKICFIDISMCCFTCSDDEYWSSFI